MEKMKGTRGHVIICVIIWSIDDKGLPHAQGLSVVFENLNEGDIL